MAHALVFDSGVGGLSVVEEIRRLVPAAHLDYVADDAFRPYGEKTAEALRARLPGLLRSLEILLSPDVIVIACNTASTAALDDIRAEVSCPVIGVVPAIKPAAQKSKTKTIAVLGTPRTIRLEYVDKLIEDFAKDCRVVLHGSTQLVALAEKQLAGGAIEISAVRDEIMPIFKHTPTPDIVVLACTHFPLLLEALKQAAPADVQWIDSGVAIAMRLKNVLAGCHRLQTPKHEQIAFTIGGKMNSQRAAMFKTYGFDKCLVLQA